MVRSIVAVIAGVLVGGIVVGIVELPGMFFHPLPPEIKLSDAEALKNHAAKAPFAAQLCVALAWTLGPFVGSWLTAHVARKHFLAHGLIVGIIFLAADVFNLQSFPHPLWLSIVGVLAPLISSWLGATIGARTSSQPPSGPRPYDMRKKNMAC
jgi:uncharacterized protein YacL